MTARKSDPPPSPLLRRESSPVGLPTRGKTAPNRLRRSDILLALYAPEYLRRLPGLFVDLGYGASAVTTLETCERLRRFNPQLKVLGVEIDAERVASAKPFSGPHLEFRLGGFNLPVQAGEPVAVIRALNVLRQYPEDDFAPSVGRMGSYLVENGLLLEGTSDPTGRLMALNIFRRRPDRLSFEALALSVRWSAEFSPRALQAILPKNCIHHVEPGSPLDDFFRQWERVWPPHRAERLAGIRLSIREMLARDSFPVDPRERFLRRGFILLQKVPGIEDPSIPLPPPI